MFGATQVIKIVAVLIIVLVVAGGLWYVTQLKADLAVSQMNEQKLKDSVSAQNALLESMKKDIADIQATNSELQAQAREHEARVKELTDKINVNAKGEARDFGALAAAKPR